MRKFLPIPLAIGIVLLFSCFGAIAEESFGPQHEKVKKYFQGGEEKKGKRCCLDRTRHFQGWCF